ncbi:methylenetetrahydrofolate reductase [NAD(P)H] [Rubricoccus marinus]|uniref:Methylenetetrahydrofolate reductase n=1 Tax=Rubricoccus marinus TaxID=716817 RepID=A0A259TZP5_9BACT|nr:methylenetetrahydrofolate reductase [NAD(P)H] [Rubricoccus marinus]OZC03229.1 methylenetetrahydrofolate reductase [NAD(P)H] [Rubricoccus marinus]
MKVIEHYEQATEPLISYEIIPPKRGSSVSDVLEIVDALKPFDPPFIDVTSHAAEATYDEMPDGTIKRRVKRKRPGTLGLCAAIQHRFGIDAVPHVLCRGFTREETEDALIELNYLGIHNVLAVRGDDVSVAKRERPGRSSNVYAEDLVRQISAMNAGEYLDEGLLDAAPTNFCIGVGGYPEKHEEAPNRTWDVLNLKRKVEAGADYIVTQMFFDTSQYIDFVERCRNVGINVPIVPGLKILTTKRHLRTLPRTFKVEIPEALAAEVEAADDARVPDVGIEWARQQSEELLAAGAPGIHFYIMSNPAHVQRVVEPLRA